MFEEKVKKLEKLFENMDTGLQELYSNQIDPKYVYNKLVELEDSEDATYGLMGKGKTWEQCENKVKNTFKERAQREHVHIEIAHGLKGKKSGNKQRELLFLSFTSKRRNQIN